MPPRGRAKTAPKEDPTPEVSEADGSLVTSVSRNVDGSPAETAGFRLLVQEGASDADKAAAWNLGGELPPEELIVYVPKPAV